MAQSFYIFGGVILFLAFAIFVSTKYLSEDFDDEDEYASNDPIMPSQSKKGY